LLCDGDSRGSSGREERERRGSPSTKSSRRQAAVSEGLTDASLHHSEASNSAQKVSASARFSLWRRPALCWSYCFSLAKEQEQTLQW